MHKSLLALGAVLVGCSTPAYRAPEVPVPAAYGVGIIAPATSNGPAASQIGEIPTSAINVSTTLASTPFWTELGDTTLTALVREAQRANMDVRIAQSRLSSARAARRLASFDLVPTVTGTGSTSRSLTSLAQTP